MKKKVFLVSLGALIIQGLLAIVPMALADVPCDVRVNNTVGKCWSV